jgi:hypothetical protein
MPTPVPVALHASQAFASLLGLAVDLVGPAFRVTSTDGDRLAARLTVWELAGYLDAYDLAQITAAGPCCPLDRIGTA